MPDGSVIPARTRGRTSFTELGLGGAQLGNLYRGISDDDARRIVDAAWDMGIRYFDTAPHYGLGLSERRLGSLLRERPREEYVLSSKVGRLLEPDANVAGRMDDEGFDVPATMRRRWDFSRDGIRRSVHETLGRLRLDRLDVAYLHDPENHWEQALAEAVPALIELREEGVVGSIGAGMNFTDPLIELIRDDHGVDLVMCAGRYTLLEQADDLVDLASERGVGVVAAGVYNSGLLATPRPGPDPKYDYAPAPVELVARVEAIAAVCESHGVTLPDAALAFPLRHPAVISVVVGAASPEQVADAANRYHRPIPDALWSDLAAAGLISTRAGRSHRPHSGAAMTRITSVDVTDVRFPTSLSMDGSDAMNKDGDYSATYVVLRTDDPQLAGHGFTFTIGRGNDICTLAARRRGEPLVGRDVAGVVGDLGGTYRDLAADSQLRWLGPDKGVEHLAMAAVMNAAWDLAARVAGKPLWRFLSEMNTEDLVDTLDLSYLSDVLTRQEAIDMLGETMLTRSARVADMERTGYPCYTTSAGWLGYSDDKLRELAAQAIADGYRHVKLKVGANLEDDIRRCTIAREVIGWDAHLMIDANQVWDVPEAIEWVNALARFRPLWIEEPTSPDDVLGHAAVRKAVAPIGVATGEHGMNRVLFKQLFQAEAIDYCQLDSARLASINEIIPVYLMAKKFGVPVCPHAGGVGLCELVQHLSVFDYVAVAGTTENRVTEFVDHLHEHFTDPCVVERGAYVLPTKPGYSAQMFPASVADYAYPDGVYWSTRHPRAAVVSEAAVR